MKAQTLRNAIDAHGWVGILVSVPLFVVFWAGALTLFFPETTLWSTLPVVSTDAPPTASPPLREIVEGKLAGLPRHDEQAAWIGLPDEHSPFLQLHVPLEEGAGEQTGREEDEAELLIDPATGDTLTELSAFSLAGFLYELHYDLQLPQGQYLVGLVTLFFLVLVMTGVVIQLKNFVRDFFLYRSERGKRQRLNDMHTVAGVVTLPFAVLYALTGLMFNLSILYYLPNLQLVYGGDEQALRTDVGFPRFEGKAAGVTAPMPALEPLIARVEQQDGVEVSWIGLHHFGDENAVMRFIGSTTAGFPGRVDRSYEVASDSFPEALNGGDGSAFKSATSLLYTLHMAHFGGPGVRFLFFLIALGVCGMIVAGNMLWLDKREAKAAKLPRTFKAVRGFTLGGCVGLVLATCVAFPLERLLPADLGVRSSLVQGSFIALWAATTLAGFFVTRVRSFLRAACWASAASLAALALVDLVAYGPEIAGLWRQGYRGAAGVTVGLLGLSALLGWIGRLVQGGGAAERAATADSAPSPNPA